MSRIVLIESAPAAPGLLSFSAWEAITGADAVLLRNPSKHPAAMHLERAGIAFEPIPDGTLEVRDRQDLLGIGAPSDRKLANGLCKKAETGVEAVVLLGPDDGGLGRAVGLEAARRHIEVEFVFLAEMPAGGELLRLVEVEQALRHPETGCPWDLEQDHASLARYLVEETYETLDAIATGEDAAIIEELGDVLLQVVFHAQLGADRRAFTIDDVARGIADKLVRRHPHVFGDADVADAAEVTARWDELKAAEKPERDGPFDGIPTAQPALPLSAQLLSRGGKRGVPEADLAHRAARVNAGLAAISDVAAKDVLVGDVLMEIVAVARASGVDPELALRAAANRYRARAEAYLALAAERGIDVKTLDDAARAALLDEAVR